MFVRMKRVKGRDYAYLVKNRWTRTGPRQRVVGYIGAVFTIERVAEKPLGKCIDCPLEDFFKGKPREIITNLIVRELLCHGFRKSERNWWVNGELEVNPTRGFVKRRGRNVAIALNEGFLCKQTVRELRELLVGGAFTGRELANGILEAGILIEKENFVRLYECLKAHKQS